MATSISRLIVQTQDKGSASVRALLERLYRQLPMLAFAHLACNGQAQAVARLGIPPCHVRRCLVGFHILAARTEIAIKKRSEEHTSELQSLMRISYAVFCLKKKHTAIT